MITPINTSQKKLFILYIMLILPSPFSTCASKRISIPNETHTDNASINNRAGFAIFVLLTIST